ncbi:Putative fatty acyl-CoA reductase [Cladobotryum mycophilum]|uniref:Fatty acyl-CoA reductase n=1 Tax=Cladobotryum mycophilum TaxID=491253 RepID=A0ABR0SCU9_9HYPO
MSRTKTSRRSGNVIFLTGVTGFLGKVVLEELIRRREELNLEKVFVLIRPKKVARDSEVSLPSTRFEKEIANSECFLRLPADWTSLVEPVFGDLERPLCGLDDSVRERICEETTHIIHCAACVQFNLPLEEAIAINVKGTLGVLNLAQSCSKLQRMIYTSTAYVHPHKDDNHPVYETLCPLGRWKSAQALLDDFDSGTATQADIMQSTGHPNTYSLSKCITEHMLLTNRGSTRVTIVRPSIIAASFKYPCPGWTDSITAITGIVFAFAEGVSDLNGKMDSTPDVVPVDVVTDFMLEEAFAPEGSPETNIVYCVAGIEDCTSTDEFTALGAQYAQQPQLRLNYGPESPAAWLGRHLRTTVPLNLVQLFFRLVGDQRGYARIARGKHQLAVLNENFEYFSTRNFRFVPRGPTAYQNIPGYSHRNYLLSTMRGLQHHVLRTSRLRGRISAETVLAGRQSRSNNHGILTLLSPRSTWFIRIAAIATERILNRIFDKVMIDQESFHQTMENYFPASLDQKLVVLPTYQSYLDFLLCHFVFFTFPYLGIKVPRVGVSRDFSSVPIVGRLLTAMGAFFVKTGTGKPDPQLDEQIQELADQNESIMTFVQGTRSSSRQLEQPRRGFLRALQKTGKPFSVLPISISYERRPEEEDLLGQVQGSEKSRPGFLGFCWWTLKMMLGMVKLGRVHIKCGKMLDLAPDTDVRTLSRDLMAELQANNVITTYHLDSFLDSQRGRPVARCPTTSTSQVGMPWLRTQLEQRGATVLEGSLSAPNKRRAVNPLQELTLRNQWIQSFYRDMLILYPNNPAVTRHGQDEALENLLNCLLEPICADYVAVARAFLSSNDTVTIPSLKSQMSPTCQFQNAEACLRLLVEDGIIKQQNKTSYSLADEERLGAFITSCQL